MKIIYGLYAEGEDMPRYVGATQDTRARINVHRSAIRFTKAIYRVDLPDLRLQIRVLEEAEEHNWKVRERCWINHFKELGVELANADPEESRIKMIKAAANRRLNDPESGKRHSRKMKRFHRRKRERRMESLGVRQSTMDI